MTIRGGMEAIYSSFRQYQQIIFFLVRHSAKTLVPHIFLPIISSWNWPDTLNEIETIHWGWRLLSFYAYMDRSNALLRQPYFSWGYVIKTHHIIALSGG